MSLVIDLSARTVKPEGHPSVPLKGSVDDEDVVAFASPRASDDVLDGRLNRITGEALIQGHGHLNKLDIPCWPILSMTELAHEQSLRATGTIVEVDHPTRRRYLTVGNPIKLSDSIADVRRSSLLGEHTDEVLRDVLEYTDRAIEAIKASGAIIALEKKAEAA
jgi:crotonobetainyl-CoA:carnitine CoA-transferase CaiB-like acyl-CoA transferase